MEISRARGRIKPTLESGAKSGTTWVPTYLPKTLTVIEARLLTNEG